MTASVTRIFLSSTFRDFGEERELLTKRVFPALRARLRERFVELVDVDLRWGITPEAAERGEVLPICLAEIDRSRPWFIGMLGERYGWIPPTEKYDPTLVEQHPWLAEHQGGKSVTELEILHGVLNDPKMAGRAFFYFRTPSYARKKGGDYVSISSEDETKLADLKDRIRTSGFPVIENYPNPDALAKRLEADLWEVLNEAYPQADVPDAFTREQQQHEAYALPRRRLYLGGDRYLISLDEVVASGQQRILIGGHSGGGKSALIANWLERRRHAFPAEQAHEYYLGASANAASPTNLVRHLIERIRRTTGSQDDIPADPQALFDSLPTWLANASVHAGKEGYRWIVTLDGLNNLTDLRDLRWLPEFLPVRVHLIVSCLPGAVRESLATKGVWQEIDVRPLTPEDQGQLLRTYLGHYNKTLEVSHEERVLAHPLASNPLFLRTLAEELRLFGRHEDLSDQLDRYLSSLTVDDLFERFLERVEQDCGVRRVKKALTAIWASRAGLTEEELLAYAGLVPATWAPIRLALDESLLESGGRLTFAHDHMRIAVSDRYLAGNDELEDENQSAKALALRKRAHEKLAKWFAVHSFPDDARSEDCIIDIARAVEEIPYQWRAAKSWRRLKALLTNRDMLAEFIEHRPSEELLGYWLEIEYNSKTTLQRAYQAAWKQWAPVDIAQRTEKLAGNLATFLREAGRFKHPLARQLAEFALSAAEKRHGSDHSETGAVVVNLAELLRDLGDFPNAELLCHRALDITSRAKGFEDPETSSRLNDLAILFKDQGNYDSAEPLLRRALAIAEKVQGPNHPDTGERLNNLAGVLKDKGDYDEAEGLYRRALTNRVKSLGAEHPLTSTSLNNLGLLLTRQGNYVEAEGLLRRALAVAETTQGPRHPSTGLKLNNLALLLRKVGKPNAAEPLIRRALAIAEKAQGPDHPATGIRYNVLASILHVKGDHEEAEMYYRRAHLISRKALGENHPSSGVILHNLACLLRDKGDYDAAETLFGQTLSIFERALGTAHPITGKNYNSLGLLLDAKGDFEEAEKFYRLAQKIAKLASNRSSPDLIETLTNLASMLIKNDRLDEAEFELHNALAIHTADEARSENLAKTLSALGNVNALRGDIAKSREFYHRSMEALMAQGEPDNDEVSRLMVLITELNAG
jgi:nephrocystin-3